jgi:TolB-like protein
LSFFEELKRRNVVRVALAYGVASWVILQVADLVLDNVEAPGWVMHVFMLVVALGFLASVVIAWAYEITPEGIKKESDVERSQSISGKTGKKLDRVIILFLALAVTVLLVERSMTPQALPEQQPAAATETQNVETPDIAAEPAIAVGLKVASRTSSFIYKGENLNIPAIASELKVNHILEGSVRKAGNRVRITAQLIDTTDDRHLWSDTFDRELVDIFAIQDEIANAIVSALKEELGVGLEAVSVETATENLAAYDLYLKARGLFIARQNLEVSTRLLERATQLDPGFVQAWETLAAAHSVSDSWLAGDGIDHYVLARAAAEKALELDPNLSMAYAVLAQIPGVPNDHKEMIELFDKAVINDPKNSTAWLWRGITLVELGHFERAISNFEKCLVIDPGYLNCAQHMAKAYLFWGKVDRAIEIFEESIESNFHSTDDIFVSHYLKSGQRVVAFLLGNTSIYGEHTPVKEWIEAIENPQQDQSARIAVFQRWADEQNISICFMNGLFVSLKLDHCYESLADGGVTMIWHADAAYFRNTAAFKEIINKNLMSYWREHGFPSQCRDLGDGDFECI